MNAISVDALSFSSVLFSLAVNRCLWQSPENYKRKKTPPQFRSATRGAQLAGWTVRMWDNVKYIVGKGNVHAAPASQSVCSQERAKGDAALHTSFSESIAVTLWEISTFKKTLCE